MVFCPLAAGLLTTVASPAGAWAAGGVAGAQLAITVPTADTAASFRKLRLLKFFDIFFLHVIFS
jgi:hypothetical protein